MKMSFKEAMNVIADYIVPMIITLLICALAIFSSLSDDLIFKIVCIFLMLISSILFVLSLYNSDIC